MPVLSRLFGVVQERGPRRAALVIGIDYTHRTLKDGRLLGPRNGAIGWRKLLIERLKFKEEDIVLMIEDAEDAALVPTKANILQQLKNLVRDAQQGDLLVFYYAGHGGQIPCKEDSEDDFKDEVIIPVDYDTIRKSHGGGFIKDNCLHQILVHPLPSGVKLRAIFDTCHSATLLDLKHHECNLRRLLSLQGNRRSKRSLPTTEDPLQLRTPARALSLHEVLENSSGSINVPASEAPPIIVDAVYSGKENTIVKAEPRRTSASSIDSQQSTTSVLSFRNFSAISVYQDDPPRCSSPEPSGSMWLKKCTGDCSPGSIEAKDVISLSACTDAQEAVEVSRGDSATQLLIRLLKSDPHASVGKVWKDMSDGLDETIRRLRRGVRELSRTDGKSRDLPDYQDPQFGSMSPLDLDMAFIP